MPKTAKTNEKSSRNKETPRHLQVMKPDVEVLSLVDFTDEGLASAGLRVSAPEKPEETSVCQRRLNYLYATRMEQERNRLVQKYFGKKSQSGFFNKFCAKTSSEKTVNVEVKVTVTT